MRQEKVQDILVYADPIGTGIDIISHYLHWKYGVSMFKATCCGIKEVTTEVTKLKAYNPYVL